MQEGRRLCHKSLGEGTVQPYVNFDNTIRREETYRSSGIVFLKLDNPPKDWASVVQVDIEACELIGVAHV